MVAELFPLIKVMPSDSARHVATTQELLSSIMTQVQSSNEDQESVVRINIRAINPVLAALQWVRARSEQGLPEVAATQHLALAQDGESEMATG